MTFESYLDRLVVDEQTVEGREGLAGAVGMVERDMSDAAADPTGTIRDLDLLDLAN
jgi:hypothetical protein